MCIQKQQGSTLIFSMIILAVMGLATIYSLQLSVYNEKILQNTINISQVKQAADSAVQNGANNAGLLLGASNLGSATQVYASSNPNIQSQASANLLFQSDCLGSSSLSFSCNNILVKGQAVIQNGNNVLTGVYENSAGFRVVDKQVATIQIQE